MSHYVNITSITDTAAVAFIQDKVHPTATIESYMTRADNALVSTAEEHYLSASDIYTVGGYVAHQILIDYWLAVFYTYIFEESWGNNPNTNADPNTNIYFVKLQYYRDVKSTLRSQISSPMLRGVRPLAPEENRRVVRAIRG